MDSNRKTAIIAGVLFLTVLVSSMLSGAFSRSIDDPDYLIAVSADENQVLMGVLFMVNLNASVVAIPIVMYPILKRHNERLALGYVGIRIAELPILLIWSISPLLLITLSQEYVTVRNMEAFSSQTFGVVLMGLRTWA